MFIEWNAAFVLILLLIYYSFMKIIRHTTIVSIDDYSHLIFNTVITDQLSFCTWVFYWINI